MDLPLFGRRKKLIEKIDAIDNSWHVEIWEEHYYFLRMEVYVRKKERFVRNRAENVESKLG